MGILNINIPVPEEILFILKKNEESLQKEILKIIAMQFFQQRKISLGKASKLAGMNKNDFIEFLGQHEIDIYQYTEKELEKELDFVDRIVKYKNENRS